MNGWMNEWMMPSPSPIDDFLFSSTVAVTCTQGSRTSNRFVLRIHRHHGKRRRRVWLVTYRHEQRTFECLGPLPAFRLASGCVLSPPPSSQQLKVGASVRAVANLVLVQGPLAPDPQKAIRWGPSAMLQRESGSETERRWWA
jgi:hypothetical protein